MFVSAGSAHHASQRSVYPFVRINCPAIPRDLLESELFGYEKGAFTGARAEGKPGKFELADHGTVFLDEIGDLPFDMQPKLLRVLEEKEFERIGGNRLIRSNFRLIAATNQNLEEMLAARRFRKDLFYRLNVIGLRIAPLRERRDDILPIARHLLQHMAEDANLPGIRIDPRAEDALTDYHWPGNVRELSNVLERAMSALEGGTIHVKDLPFHLTRHGDAFSASPPDSCRLRETLETAEKEAIAFALKQSDGIKALAARVLGIHRTLLYKKMKKHRLM